MQKQKPIIAYMKFDLHSHSTASDGKFSPEAVLALAKGADLDLFALTDHDNIDGFLRIKAQSDLTLVSGIEVSTTWLGIGVHIVGLDFDPGASALTDLIKSQQNRRVERAERIAQKLAQKGFQGTLEGALSLSADPTKVGRPHFAEFLVSQGHVKSVQQAFTKYLGNGKCADVKSFWPEMQEAIDCIVKAGGVPVLAHPFKYKLTRSKRLRLLQAFAEAGGLAVEVTDRDAPNDRLRDFQKRVQALNLAASAGSDFHGIEGNFAKIGQVGRMPSELTPVWSLFKRTRLS